MKAIAESVVVGFEAVGVALLAGGALISLVRYAQVRLTLRDIGEAYTDLRRGLGRAILLGLEVLVAADIIRTVAVRPSVENVLSLGGIVFIRTFLSLSLQTEITGTLPWRRAGPEGPEGL